jgi:hypothetical protein
MISSLQARLFQPVLAILQEKQLIQSKWLTMNYLRGKPGFPNQLPSRLIKPNQVIFLNRTTRQSIRPILHQFTGDFAFRGPKPAPVRVNMSSQSLDELAGICGGFRLVDMGGKGRYNRAATQTGIHP